MTKPVRKAVLPVAGLGTRVLPATKSIPKEMLTVLDRPAIAHVLAEAIEAGIEHIVMVTGRNKGAIEDYFDLAYELEATLEQKGKMNLLSQLRNEVPAAGSVSFVRQQAPLGLGHAVWCARDIIGNEPFAVMLPDVLTLGSKGCLAQCLDTRLRRGGGNVIAVEDVGPERAELYGVIDPEGDVRAGMVQMRAMIEKPPREEAPSTLAILGRYVLEPEIFDHLEKQKPGAGGEIQLTDAMDSLLIEQPFFANIYEGAVHDIGNFPGLLRANAAFALASTDYRDDFLTLIADEMKKAGVKLSEA